MAALPLHTHPQTPELRQSRTDLPGCAVLETTTGTGRHLWNGMDQNFLVGHTGAIPALGREDAPRALPGLEPALSPHSTAQEPGNSCGLCQLGLALGAALAARSQNCSSSEPCPCVGLARRGRAGLLQLIQPR